MKDNPMKQNPYVVHSYSNVDWFYDDEHGFPHGPFQSQLDALHSLLDHIDYGTRGPSLWQRLRAFCARVWSPLG